MTEEHPINNVQDYGFPEQYFSKLREYNQEGCERFYDFVSGRLYQDLTECHGFGRLEACDVSELLEERRLDEAENYVFERLENNDR